MGLDGLNKFDVRAGGAARLARRASLPTERKGGWGSSGTVADMGSSKMSSA